MGSAGNLIRGEGAYAFEEPFRPSRHEDYTFGIGHNDFEIIAMPRTLDHIYIDFKCKNTPSLSIDHNGRTEVIAAFAGCCTKSKETAAVASDRIEKIGAIAEVFSDKRPLIIVI